MTAPAPLSPTRWVEAEVVQVARLTGRIVGIYLRAPIACHLAGQHVELRLTAEDGYAVQRSYSIASAPGVDPLELAIERLDEGEVSPFFHDVVRAGDRIELRGPLGGHFVWRAQDGGPLLLVAGGSGLAPLMAMLRAWAQTATQVPLLLVASARTSDEIVFRDELLQLEARHAAFSFVAVTTRGPKRREKDLDQRLDGRSLQSLLARWQPPRHAFVCGANRFVEAVSQGLVDAGVPAMQIRTERYGGA